MSERQIEMVWPCHCGTKNLGRYMKCQSCGHPKDDGVEYEMPENVETAASVTDEKLLRMATAGENWHCSYCGSDQRALDGSCGQCGAGRAERANEARAHARPNHESRERRRARSNTPLLVALAIACALLLGTCALVWRHDKAQRSQTGSVVVMAPQAITRDLAVTRVHWKRTVSTDRWQLVPREGFDVPDDAVDKKAAGQRVHHQDQVLDHMETVYDNVAVPDGTRSESYTEHVACGQNCTTSPRSCRQSCTSNKNGFATCRDICTGGTQSCSPKYCDETRTRQVPQTRIEHRPRQEPRYRSEPRYAPWFTYQVYDWAEIDTQDAEGLDVSPAWPDAGVTTSLGDSGAPKHQDAGLAKERERRVESFDVTLLDDKGASYTYQPANADELASFTTGSHHTMKSEGGRLVPEPLAAASSPSAR